MLARKERKPVRGPGASTQGGAMAAVQGLVCHRRQKVVNPRRCVELGRAFKCTATVTVLKDQSSPIDS